MPRSLPPARETQIEESLIKRIGRGLRSLVDSSTSIPNPQSNRAGSTNKASLAPSRILNTARNGSGPVSRYVRLRRAELFQRFCSITLLPQYGAQVVVSLGQLRAERESCVKFRFSFLQSVRMVQSDGQAKMRQSIGRVSPDGLLQVGERGRPGWPLRGQYRR
jgi:superfamily II DNA or RNA helicase